MRVTLKRIQEKEAEQVIIECVEVTSQIKEISAYVQSIGTGLLGFREGKQMERFQLEQVYYFEALDDRLFAYTKNAVYEMKQKLYEIEEAYKECHFVRCSKSVVLNLMLLESISPALNGRFWALMKNGEKLMISRQYAPKVKAIIMGRNGN